MARPRAQIAEPQATGMGISRLSVPMLSLKNIISQAKDLLVGPILPAGRVVMRFGDTPYTFHRCGLFIIEFE